MSKLDKRTDLALEAAAGLQDVAIEENTLGEVKISSVYIDTDEKAKRIGKAKGKYITVQVPNFGENGGFDADAHSAIKNELLKLIPGEGLCLVVGIGNTDITPDAFGPKTADGILATRHISGELARSIGLQGLRSVAVVSPGVLGQTGIESWEMVKSIVSKISPVCVICIDALVAGSLSRLGNTVQISDSGISPGSGVGNKRPELSEATLGAKVISIGVPTVVNAQTIVSDITKGETDNIDEFSNMIVTPREIDLMIDRSAEMVSFAINCALQSNIDPKILQSLI